MSSMKNQRNLGTPLEIKIILGVNRILKKENKFIFLIFNTECDQSITFVLMSVTSFILELYIELFTT